MTHDHLFGISLQRQEALKREWEATCNIFRAFHGLPPHRRFHHLGLLFESVVPWLERGIRVVVLRHFLVLPQETLVARLFARAARLEELPGSHEGFLLWVEAMILKDLAEPCEARPLVSGAQGEPSVELQRSFNALPLGDRAILYLFVVEGLSLAEIASRTKIPVKTMIQSLKRGWGQICEDGRPVRLPHGWRSPENLLLGGAFGRRRREEEP